MLNLPMDGGSNAEAVATALFGKLLVALDAQKLCDCNGPV
jgi:hypothetical protein